MDSQPPAPAVGLAPSVELAPATVSGTEAIVLSLDQFTADVIRRVEETLGFLIITEEIRASLRRISAETVINLLDGQGEFRFASEGERDSRIREVIKGIAEAFRNQVFARMAGVLGPLAVEVRIADLLSPGPEMVGIRIDLPRGDGPDLTDIASWDLPRLVAAAHFANRSYNFGDEVLIREEIDKRDLAPRDRVANLSDLAFCLEKSNTPRAAIEIVRQAISIAEDNGVKGNILFRLRNKLFRLTKILHSDFDEQAAVTFYEASYEDPNLGVGEKAIACRALMDLFKSMRNMSKCRLWEGRMMKLRSEIGARSLPRVEGEGPDSLEEAVEQVSSLPIPELRKWSSIANDERRHDLRILFMRELLRRPQPDQLEREWALKIISMSYRDMRDFENEKAVVMELLELVKGEPSKVEELMRRLRHIDRIILDTRINTLEIAVKERAHLDVRTLVHWVKIAEENGDVEARIALAKELVLRPKSTPKVIILNLKVLSSAFENAGNLSQALHYAEELAEFQRHHGDERWGLTMHRVGALKRRIRQAGRWEKVPDYEAPPLTDRRGHRHHSGEAAVQTPAAAQAPATAQATASAPASEPVQAPASVQAPAPAPATVPALASAPVQAQATAPASAPAPPPASVPAKVRRAGVTAAPAPARPEPVLTPTQELTQWLTAFQDKAGSWRIKEGFYTIPSDKIDDLVGQIARILRQKDVICAEVGNGQLPPMLGKLKSGIHDGRVREKLLEQLSRILSPYA